MMLQTIRLKIIRPLFCVAVVFSFTLLFPSFVDATTRINEFTLQSGEWIELFNETSSAQDLTGWTIEETDKDGNNGSTLDLSGTVPRSGFLTFEFPEDSLDDNSGILILKDNTGTEEFKVCYSNDAVPSGCSFAITSPGLNQSANAQEGHGEDGIGQWTVASTNRGWCFPGSGHGCPEIATVVSNIENGNTSTNLASQTDLSRIDGLYFEHTENGSVVGKITFLKEMNFTDQDALSWMESLGPNKINMQNAEIKLDADLINSLVDTQAQLTMYNVDFNDPKILVDNQEDTGGVVSGFSYDDQANTITFTAAHFTTFTAVEQESESSSSTSSDPKPPQCDKLPPTNKPFLYQINTTPTTATLYFTPVNDYLDHYYISYGYWAGDARFGVQYSAGFSTGAEKYTINCLSPNTTYNFQVRGGNGCATGGWSNWLTATTDTGIFYSFTAN
ncbi:MAG: hypothetical protein U9O78_01425 [Patescibacteria group bacterium]|nr:hypothetical protein [Patescibacteria group bacterium]